MLLSEQQDFSIGTDIHRKDPFPSVQLLYNGVHGQSVRPHKALDGRQDDEPCVLQKYKSQFFSLLDPASFIPLVKRRPRQSFQGNSKKDLAHGRVSCHHSPLDFPAP